MEITLKNRCCLYVIIPICFFSVMICNLLIGFPSHHYFGGICQPNISTESLKMYAAGCSEILLLLYQTTRRGIPQCCEHNIYHPQNPISQVFQPAFQQVL